MNLPTTGKYSHKPYKCPRCGHEESHGTNYWGKIYVNCKGCSWKNPTNPIVAMECQEPVPEGMGIPEEWKITTLGEIAEIIKPPRHPLG